MRDFVFYFHFFFDAACFLLDIIFYKQFDFQFEPGVANGFCKKQPQSCLMVA